MIRRLICPACSVLLLACTRPAAPPPPLDPPALKRVEATHGVVAAAHPLAAAAGVDVLREGGNAIDAAVATAFAVSVVEPMMAGIGGGGAMTIWLEPEGRAEYIDFYAAPGADSMWGAERPPEREWTREQRVAIPGAVAGLLAAHERYGRLSRERVLAPAIRLAREGFPVYPLLARTVAETEALLRQDSAAALLLFPGGRPIQAGDILVQPELAGTLERIARHGRDGFYRGPVAEALVATLRAGGSPITPAELAAFAPRWRRPLCGEYGGRIVLTAPPPLGGAEVLQALELLEPYPLDSLGLPTRSPEALALFASAVRIARADRSAWIGFPDDVGVPAVGLASEAYARERRDLIAAEAPDTLRAGDPWEEERSTIPARCAALDPWPAASIAPPPPLTSEETQDDAHDTQTTHLSVVDRERNAVSLTYTLGRHFGAGVYSGGAFYNSAMVNFSSAAANRRAPGRTPRSTTAPTIVLDGDDVRLVAGAAGSGHIPPAIVGAIVYTLDYGLDPWTALAMPRVSPAVTRASVDVEPGIAGAALAGLRRRGYAVEVAPSDPGMGGAQIILVHANGMLIGAADPRRDGAALGY